MNTDAPISWTREGDVLEVALHRAPANEIGLSSLEALETLASHIADGADGARVVLFHSQLEGAFCAGADLKELYAGVVERRAAGATPQAMTAEVRDFLQRIHHVYALLDQAPLVTVGALHGVVFGGGFELALCCDVLVADKSTRFAFPELRLGLIPGWGGLPRLARDVGHAVVRDLLFTGKSLRASRAHELGLVSQLVAKGEALNVARAAAKQAARFNPDAVRAAKRYAKAPIPAETLAEERDVFCARFTDPVVEAALADFAGRTDALPYLPRGRA